MPPLVTPLTIGPCSVFQTGYANQFLTNLISKQFHRYYCKYSYK